MTKIADRIKNEVQFAAVISQVSRKLDDNNNSQLGQAALQFLRIIADRLDEAQIAMLVPKIDGKLNSLDSSVREEALNLASLLLVWGKYKNAGLDKEPNLSVQALSLKNLLQTYAQLAEVTAGSEVNHTQSRSL